MNNWISGRMSQASSKPSPIGLRRLSYVNSSRAPIKNHTRSKSPPSTCAATSKFDLAITKIGLIYHFNCNKKLIFPPTWTRASQRGIAISTEWLSDEGFIRDRQGEAMCRSWVGILSCGVMSLRRRFCRRCPVGARREHSRSDAESGGVGAARAGDGTKSISSGGARRLAPSPHPSNEWERT